MSMTGHQVLSNPHFAAGSFPHKILLKRSMRRGFRIFACIKAKSGMQVGGICELHSRESVAGQLYTKVSVPLVRTRRGRWPRGWRSGAGDFLGGFAWAALVSGSMKERT